MEQLFDKYLNIQLFLDKYRGYSLKSGKYYEYPEFKNKIQSYGYVSHELKHKTKPIPLYVYLMSAENKYIKTSSEFGKLMDTHSHQSDIFVITKERLSIHLEKSIKKYKHLNIKNYFHKNFMLELSKGPLCARHTILTPEEVKQLCYDIMIHGHQLPAIPIDDPQIIWIGAEINDVVKIEYMSELTGTSVRYRIVTPSGGRSDIITSKRENTDELDDNATEAKEDIEEVIEEDEETEIGEIQEEESESETETHSTQSELESDASDSEADSSDLESETLESETSEESDSESDSKPKSKKSKPTIIKSKKDKKK